ncbi:MAG: hypothetical protein EXS37_13120 [Opitutus sp.]|nr:hypothetical protein [Opitutus sp.]
MNSSLRHSRSTELPASALLRQAPTFLAAVLLGTSVMFAQVRPALPIAPVQPIAPGGGAPVGGAAGGGNAGGRIPGIGLLPGGGGGGGAAITQPAIVSPRGGLAGESLTARAVLPTQAGLGQGTAPAIPSTATYQWTISGGRITSDPRTATVQFVSDAAGTVTLNVAIAADGTTYNPTSQVIIVSAETAGTVTTTSTISTSAASFTASVPAAQNGDRTFRWTASGGAAITAGQGTSSITVRPGAPGLMDVTCNVNLQNLVNVPVQAYVVVTGAGAPATVTINGGSGGGTFPSGSRLDVFANAPATGQVFDRWTGNIEVLGAAAIGPTLAHTVITIPDSAVTLTATYKAAPVWTAVTVQNFNPQTQAGANGQTTNVSTTLAYYIPANATGIAFVLHDTGGNTSDWFTRPEHLLFARDLVAAGYGVAALNSTNRTPGAWAAQTVLANNPDAQNVAAALDRFARDGLLANTKPVFFVGTAAGGNAAIRIADLLAPSRPVKGAVLYLSAGIDTLAVTSRVPQFFALAANDDVLGPLGLLDARDNSRYLTGRGIATAVINNGISPVLAGRFRALGVTAATFTAADAQAIWTAVKNAGFLDANNYLKSTPTTAALTAALPAAYQSRVADVAAQLAVASANREFYSDANSRVLNFLNGRVADAPTPAPGRLINLSTRSKIVHLSDSFALGFNISGTQPATLLIRGIGPALAKFGLSTALPAPRLEINRGTTVIASNDGWDKTPAAGASTAAQIATAAAGVGAFALSPGDLDAAVLLQLTPGTYTVTIRGINGSIGDVLAEIYDVSRNGTRLTNLSTRARISTTGDLLIPGIVIAGNNPRTLIVRAVAQGLSDFGVTSDLLLGDPSISILTRAPNGNIQTVDQNNNWAQAGTAILSAAFPAVGAFPLRAASDAALINALAPGSYTLQAGAAPTPVFPAGVQVPANFVTPNQTGEVLVEVYEVP